MQFLSQSPKETAALAKILGREVLKTKSRKRSLVFALTGELGSGKTTFIKSFLKSLGVKERILSPTFVIVKRFGVPGQNHFTNVYHLDTYRIPKKDLLRLGFRNLLKESNILVIEWAEKLRSVLPVGTFWINLRHGRKTNERYLTFNRR